MSKPHADEEVLTWLRSFYYCAFWGITPMQVIRNSMKARDILLLILIINQFNHIYLDWVSPFFKEGPRDDIAMRINSVGAAIIMDEEIPANETHPIIIAIVDGYTGSEKPRIGSFDQGSNFELGLDFQLNDDSEWNVVVKNKQDYEQPSMQRYIFSMQIDGVSKTIQVQIDNIFDNAPVVTTNNIPCQIPVSLS